MDQIRLREISNIDEVTMKLVGWPTQSYPVRILVDDKVVFAGNTPRSLGYVTLPSRPSLVEVLGLS